MSSTRGLIVGGLLAAWLYAAAGCGSLADGPSPATASITSTMDGGHLEAPSTCSPACRWGFTCCGGECVDLANDLAHCGSCGTSCVASTGFCSQGRCALPRCLPDVSCGADQTCCGSECCNPGSHCCVIDGPGVQHTICTTEPACPSPCPNCR